MKALLFIILGYASAQSPLTVLNGQWCTNYFNAENPCDWSNDPYDPNQAGDYKDVCAPGGQCCPWALNEGCTFEGTYGFNGGGRRLLQQETGSSWDCESGCVSVASCTPIPNAVFTGPSGPPVVTGSAINGDLAWTYSPTGCPFVCNSGYLVSGYSCVATCSSGQYSSGGACLACRTCPKGQFISGCSGASAGTCSNCTN